MRAWKAALVLSCWAAGACSSPAPGAAGPDYESHRFELYSWLSTGRDNKALDTLYALLHRRDPTITILGTGDLATFRATAGTELFRRISERHPPDCFQSFGGGDLFAWAEMGAVAPLALLAADNQWANAFPRAVLDSVRWNGIIHAVPMNVERDNTLFYNKKLFASAGISPPATIAEVVSSAQTLRAKGITPLSVSSLAGWTVGSMLFESVLVAEAGPAFYQAYLTGQLTADAPEVRTALTDLATLLDYANADRSTTTWIDAVDDICTDKSAMLIMPDFIRGQLADRGCLSPQKIGYVALQPAQSPTFVFIGIAFPLAKDAAHPRNGTVFLEVAASKEAQVAFSREKGSLPARADVELTDYDFLSVEEFADWTSPAESLVLGYAALTSVEFQTAVDDALQRFADPASPDHKNVETVLAVLTANYANIRPR
jgi:glucose/mannose transport system substrate-binding protein